MGRHIFRAVYLTLIIGSVLHCGGSEPSETPKTEADFTTTIPKAGLEKDVQQVFTLGPSNTLQVTDETGDAVYLPKEGENLREALANPYGVAYRFVNGACDFNERVKFTDAFPGYAEPLWVREASSSGEGANLPSGKAVRYTFTNPPAEYLGGGLSFCVKFKTVLAAGSGSQTTVSTMPTPETTNSVQPEETIPPGVGNNQSQNPDADSVTPPPPNPGPSVQEPDSNPEIDQEQDDTEQHEEGNGADPVLPSDRPSNGNGVGPSPPAKPPVLDQTTGGGLVPEPPKEADLESEKDNQDIARGEGGVDVSARSRRLSGTPAEKEAYLTIIVHSAAGRFAGGMSALSLFLFALTGTLLPVS
ncbi:UNVERIFIED_CONTAM: toxoplasma gondii family A protein [Hammondia hammondi]|eukprot:XP_008887113.1 toxoplasma gondii family A protein [Hammondia hammondi]